MLIKYFPEIDRFGVACESSELELPKIIASNYFKDLEYFRYIPCIHISSEQIHRYLSAEHIELCCEITRACNFGCPICIANSALHRTECLSHDRFLEYLNKYAETIRRITITGGEPTLHPKLMEMVSAASHIAECVVLATNGFLPDTVEEVTRNVKNVALNVSLHGGPKDHDDFVGKTGAFDRAFETVQRSLAMGLRVDVLTTLNPSTFDAIPRLVNRLKGIPISEHRLNMLKPRGRRGRKIVTWDQAIKLAAKLKPSSKLSIKRYDYPFLFIGHDGTEEIRNVI
jgi:MoaA/NifB/PqqE/SkfB family radical SAM enzyme